MGNRGTPPGEYTGRPPLLLTPPLPPSPRLSIHLSSNCSSSLTLRCYFFPTVCLPVACSTPQCIKKNIHIGPQSCNFRIWPVLRWSLTNSFSGTGNDPGWEQASAMPPACCWVRAGTQCYLALCVTNSPSSPSVFCCGEAIIPVAEAPSGNNPLFEYFLHATLQ